MKKQLIAAAVVGVFAVPAMAQVTLSGRASMEVGTWKATGATAGATADFKNRTRVADTASRITFAASEDLGGGLRAGILCETGINADTANLRGQAGTDNVNTNFFCSREGRVFIGNSTAELRLGRQNVFWTQGALNPLGSTFLGSDNITNIIVSGGAGVYQVRGENMIKVVGGSALGAFANSEVYLGYPGTDRGEWAGANTSASARYQGFKLNYSAGPLFAMWDNQSSKDVVVSGTDLGKRSANKVGVGYRFGPATVAVQTARKDRTVTATNVKTADSSLALLAQYSMGPTMLHLGYAKADDLKVGGTKSANTGAAGYTLGVTHALSKRTHFYGSYHSITNESAAAYNMGGGAYQSGAPAAGADTKAMGLGIIHNF